MKNYLKQHQRHHGCQFKNGGARLQSVLLLMLLTWMLLPARMAAQTDYDASVTFTAITGSDNHFDNEGYGNLFDGKKTESEFSKWCCRFSNPTYVIFEASKPGTPVGYTITTGNDNNRENGRNPKSWNLYGNNEGENGEWTLIQAVTDDNTLQDENYTPYDFTCDGIGSYKYFKWEISATKGASVMQVSEFELKLITCTHKKEDGSSALSEALSTVPATCIKHSYSTYKCSICNNTIKIENDGDFAPHNIVHHEAKAPKCTKDGNIEYWQCSVCDKLFSDELATSEYTEQATIVIPAEGHKLNSEGTCTVCGYKHDRYSQIAMNGVTILSITDDTQYPWEILDPDEISEFSFPKWCNGLMSNKDSNYDITSSSTIKFKSDKPFVLSFNYGVTYAYIGIFLDDNVNDSASNDELKNSIVYENNDCYNKEGTMQVPMSAGEHKLRLSMYKSDSGSDYPARAFIYNLKATFTGAVAEYDQGAKAMTLKFQENEELGDNACLVEGGTSLKSAGLPTNEIESIVIDESFKSYKPTSLQRLFSYCTALTKIEGVENINTADVENMSYMFSNCSSLKTLDLSSLNTEKVNTVAGMFSDCNQLESLIMPDIDKSNLKDYDGFMQSCNATIYCTPNEASKGSNSLYASYKMSPYFSINPKSKYGTLCVPMGSTLAEGSFTGFDKLYTIDTYDTEKNVINLQEATNIEPGVPYIYRRNITDTDPVANAITFIADLSDESFVTAPVNDGMLKGTFKATTAPSGSYVLQSDGMFHPVRSNTIKVGAYRAYLQIPGFDNTGDVEAKNFQMVFEEDETTDVKGVYEHTGSMAPTVYYDLMGRIVSSPAKGQVYIVNGKKVRF